VQRREYACIQIIIIQYDHEKLKQVSMVMRDKWNNIEKIGYKLDQASKIITHARHDVFLPFLIVRSIRTKGIPTNHINIQNNQD